MRLPVRPTHGRRLSDIRLALRTGNSVSKPLLHQKAISNGAAYGQDAQVGLSRPDFAARRLRGLVRHARLMPLADLRGFFGTPERARGRSAVVFYGSAAMCPAG